MQRSVRLIFLKQNDDFVAEKMGLFQKRQGSYDLIQAIL
jgi:hypothetical protein